MRHLKDDRAWRILLGLLLVAISFRHTDAGDFALVADINSSTIYAGRMGQALNDLAPLPLSGVRRPVAVDYDPVEKMIYWTDINSWPFPKISRAHLDGSNQMTVVDNLDQPEGLALDTVSRMMYWTDYITSTIARARMDGTGSTEVILQNLDKPRGIITDHDNGHIYWTDWGDNPQIERADFDGSNRMTIVGDALGHPTSATIQGNYLYWCDAHLDLIERSDLSGDNRELVANLSSLYPGSRFIPFDLAVYDDYVYWTDFGYVAILRVHRGGRGASGYGRWVFQQAGGLHIQEEPNYCDSFPCGNGATCVDVINGFSCLCPAGFQGLFCSVDPCDSRPCLNGGVCVSSTAQSFTCMCPPGYDGTTCTSVAGCVLSHDAFDLLLVVSDQQAVYLPGDSIEYACPDGFQLSGSAVRFCQSDYTWSGQPAECLFQDHCESGPCTNGGICSSTLGGFICHCTAGYDGPTCAVVAGCLLTLDPSGLLLVVSDQQAVYPPGDSVEYACPDGYQLSGSAVRFCRSDLSWSGQPAECIPQDYCESRPCMNGGTCSSASGGFTCQCPSGYAGADCSITTVGCVPPSTPNHATLLQDSVLLFQPGDEVTITCDNGYTVTGSNDRSVTRVCLADGTWSGQPVECSPVDEGNGGEGGVPVVAIAAGAGAILLLIVVLLIVLIFIKRKRKRNSEERVVNLPVIANDGTMSAPPPYHFNREHLYEETVFNRPNEPPMHGFASNFALVDDMPTKTAPLPPNQGNDDGSGNYLELTKH